MQSSDKVNILLVDDQPSRLVSYEAILSELDQNLVRANSGVEALDKLMRDEYAVILLDVSMPGMDGFETAALIHQHPRFERTPIIFVTALHVTDLDRLKGYELGAVDYVYVPVVPQILRGKVAVLVELFLKRRELQRLNESLERANTDLAAANSSLQAEKARELERLNANLALANEELARANASLQDEISERSRLTAALREADRRKDRFLAMLAHELRNPLAPILNAAQIMRMKPFEDPELSWAREVVDRQARHLVRLVDDLLDVSRITQGKIKLQREAVDLALVVARAVETTRPLIDARRHELTVELPQQPLVVNGDVTRLAQVLGNLLNNAAKYMDEGGVIRLAAERVRHEDGSEEAVVRVSDKGLGIPADVLPSLFELFTQVEHTLDRAQGGLGIGLALVRQLVELHGGSVEARSAGSGQGSEFVVRLPLVSGFPAEEPAPRTDPAAAAAPGRDGVRVLVVEDNRDSARTMSLVLEKTGYLVETVYDGMSAVEAARRFLPDVVLMDIGLPGMDGYEAARCIRKESEGRPVAMIALTGWGQDEDRRRSREAGFEHHLVKPVDRSVLVKLLARVRPARPQVGAPTT